MSNTKTRRKKESRGVTLEAEIVAEIEERLNTRDILNWSGYLRQLVLQDLTRLRARDGKTAKS
jgi:hypothetical protein